MFIMLTRMGDYASGPLKISSDKNEARAECGIIVLLLWIMYE